MNWEVFTKLSPLEIQLHWATVTVGFLAGLLIIVLPKGTAFHKLLGRIYAVALLTTSVAAFFIRNPAVSGWEYLSLKGMTWIHLFIPLTVFGITWGIIQIRRGNVRSHRNAMIGNFLGALIIAGLFTFLPGRRMHLMFIEDPETVERIIERREAKEQP